MPVIATSLPSAPSADTLASLAAELAEIRSILETDPRIRAGALTKKQAAQYMNVCAATLDRWRQDKHDPLPTVSNGNLILFLREDLDAWLKRHRTPRINPPSKGVARSDGGCSAKPDTRQTR